MLPSEELTLVVDAARADAGRGSWFAARDRLATVEPSLGNRPDAQVLYAEALIRTGRPADATRWLARALPIVRRRDDRAGLRRSHLLSGAAGFQLGRLDEATEHFDRAIELALADGDDLVAAQATNNLGAIADIRGDRPRALARYRAAVPAYQRLGHTLGLAETFHNMAITHREQGDLDDAEELELEAIRYAQSAGDARLAALAQLERAVIRLRQGDAAFAGAVAQQALGEFERLGLLPHQADALRVRGMARLARGDVDGALADLDEAIGRVGTSASLLIEAECHRDRAVVLLELGRVDAARLDAIRALRGFDQLGSARDVASIRGLLARLGS